MTTFGDVWSKKLRGVAHEVDPKRMSPSQIEAKKKAGSNDNRRGVGDHRRSLENLAKFLAKPADKSKDRSHLTVVKEGRVVDTAVRLTMAYLMRQGGRDSATKSTDKKKLKVVKEESDPYHDWVSYNYSGLSSEHKKAVATKVRGAMSKTLFKEIPNSSHEDQYHEDWHDALYDTGHQVAKDYIKAKRLKENTIAANCVQGGHVAGIDGDPPVRKRKRKYADVRRRN